MSEFFVVVGNLIADAAYIFACVRQHAIYKVAFYRGRSFHFELTPENLFDCSYFTHNKFKQISDIAIFISPDVTQFLKLGEGKTYVLQTSFSRSVT